MKPFGSGIKIPEGTYERHIKKIRNKIRATQRKVTILKIFIK
jgi:hypothetical protein